MGVIDVHMIAFHNKIGWSFKMIAIVDNDSALLRKTPQKMDIKWPNYFNENNAIAYCFFSFDTFLNFWNTFSAWNTFNLSNFGQNDFD